MRQLNISGSKKAKKNDANDEVRTDMKEAALRRKPKSVLEAFEYIVELAENSGLDKDFLKEAGSLIRYASRKLNLTPMQTVMLALFVDKSEDNSIRISEIAAYVGCRTTRILRLSKEIDELEEMRYLIAARSSRSLSYRVPSGVIEAIKENRPYEPETVHVSDLQSFFDYFNELMDQKEDGELTHYQLLNLFLEAMKEIEDSFYVQSLRSYNVINGRALLFTYMAHLFVEDRDDCIMFHDIEKIFDKNKMPQWCKSEFRDRDNPLFRHCLIENVNEDGMARSDAFKLTEFAKRELLGELKLINPGHTKRDLLDHGSFAEKRLIYNTQEHDQINELASILSEERFRGVQERLEKAGMRKGFCCLFYGAAGTGKTETVYQLARQTGRDIMRVDVDKIKSCWVGESEKNVKSLFDRYRNICRDAERAPILLFNEADAVLGVRMEGAAKAVDKMENSLQNIILQEMETLEGIMIATTNLTTNLDKAFERRFLYKVRYEKPTVEARAEIWRTMLPGLSAADAQVLASECDLSGGEIENIVRKHSVSAILSGNETIELDALRKLCKTERIGSAHAKIGF